MQTKITKPRQRWLAAAVITTLATLALAQEIAKRGLSSGVAPATAPATYPAYELTGSPRPIVSPVLRQHAVLAILGPMSAGGPDDLRALARELDLVRPDAVLATGNLIAGFAPGPDAYKAQAKELRAVLDAMKSPWYPCVGTREIASATLDPRDTRMVAAYEKEFGPRYHSIDVGEIHAIVLDSEERRGGPSLFSAPQLEWLRQDLKSVFERRQARQVVVVTHRPAWRDKDSNWAKVEEHLVAFNRRPVVTIEGAPGDPGKRRGPRVAMVFAGSAEGYTQEDPRDGIAYYVVGPAKAAGEKNIGAGRFGQFALVDLSAGESRVSVVEAGHIHGGDLVTAAERQLLAQVESLDPAALGVQGTLPQPIGGDAGTLDLAGTGLKVVLTNPLKTSMDVEVRLAGDGLGVWEIAAESLSTRLRGGERTEYRLGLKCAAKTAEVSPPELEFRLRLKGTRGRDLETVVRRRVPLVPGVMMTALPKVDGAAWKAASPHGLWAFEPARREGVSGSFALRADAARLYVRVKVEGSAGVYAPRLEEPWALPMDAVVVAWAAERTATAVQRIIVLPFAPEGQRLLTNTGLGRKQTALTLLDTKTCPVEMKVTRAPGGAASYELELAIPRSVVPGASAEAMLNIGAFVGGSGGSEYLSWAGETAGPAAWGEVKIVSGQPPAKPPAKPWLPIPFLNP